MCLEIVAHKMLGSIPVHLPDNHSKLSCDCVGQGIVARDALSILPCALCDHLLGLEVEARVLVVETLQYDFYEH